MMNYTRNNKFICDSSQAGWATCTSGLHFSLLPILFDTGSLWDHTLGWWTVKELNATDELYLVYFLALNQRINVSTRMGLTNSTHSGKCTYYFCLFFPPSSNVKWKGLIPDIAPQTETCNGTQHSSLELMPMLVTVLYPAQHAIQ